MLLLLPLLLCTCDRAKKWNTPADDPPPTYQNWAHYGGDLGLNHYTSSRQIDTNNVSDLTVAWTYHTGDADTANASQIQCNPLVIDGVLYGTTPQMKLFAVNAATGEHHWTFDPSDGATDDDGAEYQPIMSNSRGLAHWKGPEGTLWLFYTAGSRTYSIDAAGGDLNRNFGEDGAGFIDLHDGLGRDVSKNFVVATSPGIVFENLLIMGTRVDETLPAAPGHIRAYNVATGAIEWIFHTIPQPGEPGYETWGNPGAWKYTGGANPWSGFSLDAERGVVYCGTGSASYDFYGGNRPGENLYANCILALDAKTGERKWHYQTVHHDLWDKDHPTPPVLATIDRGGGPIDVVVQPTKFGDLFILDRDTGEPVFKVREVSVPTSGGLPGEYIHPTQPVPWEVKPFTRGALTEHDVNPHLSEEDQAWVRREYAASRYGNRFLPPGEQKLIMFPGFDGGAEWGGPAFDPTDGMLYVNANQMAWQVEMEENDWAPPGPETFVTAGDRLYERHCQTCHGADRQGLGNNPPLVNIGERYDVQSFKSLLRQGRRMMPAFGQLTEDELNALAIVVADAPELCRPFLADSTNQVADDPTQLPYKLKGYKKFLAPDGMPAISPPWGTLTAVDLNSGQHKWTIPLGEYEAYTKRGIPPTGTENYGGPVVTAGGVLFIAATSDGKFRAFNKRTGALLWEVALPAAGFATPAAYEVDGRQFVVVACGGGKLGAEVSDAYVAFAL